MTSSTNDESQPVSWTRPSGNMLRPHWSLAPIFGMIPVIAQRVWSHRSLLLAIVVGYIVAIALVVCVPVYAEAVGFRVLRDELLRTAGMTSRPPFTFMYRYVGAQTGTIEVEPYHRLDAYMRDQVASRLGLPVESLTRYVATDKLQLIATDGTSSAITYVNLAFASGVENEIELLEGRLPQRSSDDSVEVIISEKVATTFGFQIDEIYYTLLKDNNDNLVRVPVRIVGVWKPINSDSPYWFYRPNNLEDVFFVSEDSFFEQVATRVPKPIYTALWYVITNGDGIRSGDVPGTRARIERTVTEISAIIPGARLEVSPADALLRHQSQVRRLTILLSVFSVPLLGLVTYFIGMVASMIVQRQSNEIAVLRGRGASRLQIMGIYLGEGILLGLAALGPGLLLGMGAALLMTWTVSFLQIEPIPLLPITLTPEAWQRAWLVLALMIAASLIPAMAAARYTIVSYKNERARASGKPLWQRFGLDFLLIIPAIYGYTQLKNRGTIAQLDQFGSSGNPFSNPLLLVAPTLYILAFALLAVRLFPLFMKLFAWVSNHLPGVSVLTALRYLARTPRAYTGPVLLLTLTLGLAAFSASMALSLDRQLRDQVNYTAGSDLQIVDIGQSTSDSFGPGIGASATESSSTSSTNEINEAQYLFLPVSDYLTIDGIEAATRVSRSEADAQSVKGRETIQLLGVDRADFAQVAYWRDDYARESLGALMNRLADDPSSIIVDTSFGSANKLQVGDEITIQLNDLGEWQSATFRVAGFTRLFPTVYPEDGPFAIANLDYLAEQQGGQFPYEVWLRVKPDASREAVLDGVRGLGLSVFERNFAPEALQYGRSRPERQGVFGLLSVGFVSAAVLTMLGFLFYAVLSFRRRFVELGTLRAIGLSAGQLATLLCCEQALIILTGMLSGTLIGVSASVLFIPFLGVRDGTYALTPPFLAFIAWDQIGIIYGVFGALLILTVGIMLLLLRRMQIFQAIKMGEAV